MRIDWEIYGKIRNYKRQGYSINKTSEILGIHRATVAKYYDGETTPDTIITRNRPIPEESIKTKGLIENYINTHKNDFIGKQRITITKIYEDIKKINPTSYSTVSKYYKEIVEKRKEAFIPLSFEPGEVMQVDWFEANVVIKNVLYCLPVFIAILAFSEMFFCMIMPNMQFESFIYAHVEAFKFFGGITKRIFYDYAAKKIIATLSLTSQDYWDFKEKYGIMISPENR